MSGIPSGLVKFVFNSLDNSINETDLSVPATVKFPFLNSMSSSLVSKKYEATVLAFFMTSVAASIIAPPDAIIDLEPPVPPPVISSSLSPCNSFIRSNGIPRKL